MLELQRAALFVLRRGGALPPGDGTRRGREAVVARLIGAEAEGEGVDAEVVRGEGDRRVEARRPGVKREVGQIGEEVHGEAGEPCRTCGGDRRHHVVGGVPSAEGAEGGRIHHLHANAEPGDASLHDTGQVAPLIGAGVRLEGHLGVGGEPEAVANAINERGESVGWEQRWRAAAEIERFERLTIGGAEAAKLRVG